MRLLGPTNVAELRKHANNLHSRPVYILHPGNLSYPKDYTPIQNPVNDVGRTTGVDFLLMKKGHQVFSLGWDWVCDGDNI